MVVFQEDSTIGKKCNMKVYAEFINDESLIFRTRTLLQFGDSWDLIGSIVMKNPGSAKPGKGIDNVIAEKLSKYYNEKINSEYWFVSDGDPTMRDILPIFNGNYVNKNFKLDGVIQIFNLYNICSPNVDFAHKKGNETQSPFLLPDVDAMILDFKKKPVYIGFGDFYTNKKSKNIAFLKNSAVKIFEFVKKSAFDYLEDDFLIDEQYYHKNHFYHPQFLNKPSKREKYLPTLEKFANFYEEN